MKIASAEQMREIDYAAIHDYGIPGVVLMENAGVEVAKQLETVFVNLQGKNICIFAGKGNNGGDGFVAARHLANQGAYVKVLLFADKDDIKGEAQTNLDIIELMDIEVLFVKTVRDWDKVKLVAGLADCIIDALLGTGFKGELSPGILQAINIINSLDKLIVAVDIPSGIYADTGQSAEAAVKADYTITFGLPKPGLMFYPGASCAGVLSVADIGIPANLLNNTGIQQNIITTSLVQKILPCRQPAVHKGDTGKVLIIAGSAGLTGAAVLTSLGALRAGAGLITLGIAASLQPVLAVKMTEVMTKALPEVTGALGTEAVKPIIELTAKADVLAIGPGLGLLEMTGEMVREVIKQVNAPLVIDADALNALIDNTGILAGLNVPAVLTPHPGEMARLTGLNIEEVNKDRIKAARDAAKLWCSTVVLKGARTVVAFPDGEVYINTTGNAGMATGGMGDVLTGIIAAIIAQGASSKAAAIAGVYLHGLAGDVLAQSGQIGLAAGDVAQAIPAAIHGIIL